MPGRPVVIVGELYDPSLSIGGGPVYPPAGGGQPPGIWGPPGPWPTPPIAPGGPPPTVTPPIYYPPFPAHPIAPGGNVPAHPIVLPPEPPPNGQPPTPGVPTFPIWGPPGTEFPPGSGYPPVAGHPLPPGEHPEPIPNWVAKVFWTPTTGWAVAVVPNPAGDANVPTPSKPAGRKVP